MLGHYRFVLYYLMLPERIEGWPTRARATGTRRTGNVEGALKGANGSDASASSWRTTRSHPHINNLHSSGTRVFSAFDLGRGKRIRLCYKVCTTPIIRSSTRTYTFSTERPLLLCRRLVVRVDVTVYRQQGRYRGRMPVLTWPPRDSRACEKGDLVSIHGISQS